MAAIVRASDRRVAAAGRSVTPLAAVLALIVSAALLAAGLLGGNYVRFITELFLINAIATMGVNVSMGFAGIVSIGNGGFAAIGAYATALLMGDAGVPFFPALLLGGSIAAASGMAIGLPALRLSPLYIAMVTFGFGEAAQLLAINWIDLTHGPNGLPVPDPEILGHGLTTRELFLFLLAMFGCVFFLCWNIRRTFIGRALMAIRGSATVAQSMGVPVARYRTIAFGLSAFLGGISGGLYALVSGFINPDGFSFSVSIGYVAMCVIGGIGTLSGPLIGAFALTALPELLRSLAEYREFLTGIILLIFLVGMPNGLVGLIERLARRLQTAQR